MISLAIDAAERQLREGTASAQVITHYLKLGSSRERLEQDRLRHETALLEFKQAAIASQQRTEELYSQALDSMRAYNGEPPPQQYDEYDD
jgi:hypothetical protein